jgi:hypothetical protein
MVTFRLAGFARAVILVDASVGSLRLVNCTTSS